LVGDVGCAISKFGLVMPEDGKKLIILDIPQRTPRLIFTEESQMSQQLSKPDVRRKLADLR
jgi:hypothetical protein